MFKRKIVTIPTGEKEELEAVESWVVSWSSKYGSFDLDWKPRFEVFIYESEAKKFKDSSEDVFKLLKHSGNRAIVTMEKS